MWRKVQKELEKQNMTIYRLTMLNYEETKFKKVLEGLRRQMDELL